MDIGCYSINLSRMLFKAEPERVQASLVRDPDMEIDVLTSGLLTFPGGATATFTCSIRSEDDQRVHLYGTEGHISVGIPFNIPPDRPTQVFVTHGGEPPIAPAVERLTFETADPYGAEADAFAATVLDGAPPPIPADDAVNEHARHRAGLRSGRGQVTARLARVDLPEFGTPDARPEVPPEVYARRLERLRERAADRGYSALVVYADREHSANLAWLSGFDPRFEEAIAIVGVDGPGASGDPTLLVGNECWGIAGASPLPLRRVLHQDLSLPSQPRHRSRPLRDELADAGIRSGSKVGVVGWKPYGDPARLDVPAYLADELRSIVGGNGAGRVENAVDLFIDAGEGLRVMNEPEQLAAFEAASCRTSEGVKLLLRDVRPGMREREAVALLGWDGSPLSCHLMLTAGERARFGLFSPGDRPIQRGDPFTTAFGIWGALTCRAGWIVEDAAELDAGIRDYLDRLVGPYFDAIAEWYGALRIGQTGGVLHEIVARRLGDPFFGIFLNAGHQISLDEWVGSPVAEGSPTELRSGMYLQVDVIPATGTPYFTTNIEDGVALADASLRAELAARYPELWERVQGRRSFMSRALGIELHEDVLPFSNIPAWLPPFVLDPSRAMTVA